MIHNILESVRFRLDLFFGIIFLVGLMVFLDSSENKLVKKVDRILNLLENKND